MLITGHCGKLYINCGQIVDNLLITTQRIPGEPTAVNNLWKDCEKIVDKICGTKNAGKCRQILGIFDGVLSVGSAAETPIKWAIAELSTMKSKGKSFFPVPYYIYKKKKAESKKKKMFHFCKRGRSRSGKVVKTLFFSGFLRFKNFL